MARRPTHVLWPRPAWSLGVLVLIWMVGPPAWGQVHPDTARTDTMQAVAPPAPLDSVEAADAAPPDTSERERAIVTADSLSAVVQDDERIQELFNNVNVRQDTTRLQSAYGRRYLSRDELLFTGDVVIFERGDTLRADTVWYNKRTKVGRARSNVRLTDGEVVVTSPRAIYFTEEKRSVFPDSVTLVDSSRVLRAEEGTYWSDDRRAEFRGNVRLTDPETTLEADSLTYFRDEERSIATGSVFIRRSEAEGPARADTSSITYLFGDWADNQEQNRYSRVERQALLVRVRMDSTGAPTDTLAVRAHQLEAQRTDTYRRLVAVDSVRIWQADLAAVADSAVYDRVIEAGPLDSLATPSSLPAPRSGTSADSATGAQSSVDSLVAGAEPVGEAATDRLPGEPAAPRPESDTARPSPDAGPAPPPDTTVPASDSLRADTATADTTTADTSGVAGARTEGGWDLPTAQPDDTLPLEETRLFQNPITWFERSQVWGDSIRVRARNRSLDTVYVRRAAFAAQEDTTVDRIRQLKGRNITAFFRRDSLRRILARPNGEAIHFSTAEDGSLNGATQASADYVELYFRNGEVRRTKFGRGVQGKAYHKKKHIPDPFRLEGFQWTPERRPTRGRLLRGKRVRERLDLDRPPRSPPPVARAPADSTGVEPPGPASTDGPADGHRRDGAGPAPSDSLAAPVDSVRTHTPSESTSDTTDTSPSHP